MENGLVPFAHRWLELPCSVLLSTLNRLVQYDVLKTMNSLRKYKKTHMEVKRKFSLGIEFL